MNELEARILAAKRLLAAREARDSLLKYCQFSSPHPEHVNDPDFSNYIITPQAKLLCELLQKVERGEERRVCVSIGPQLGKSEIISRKFPAWFAGRNPTKNFMLGTYNQDFAEEFGGDVRNEFNSAAHRQVFENFDLRKGSKAKDFMITDKGGKLSFIGRGGSGSGKPADVFVIDDPLKNEAEASSPAVRLELWNWFSRVVVARAHNKTAIVIVHTRWNEDDLIGRLCDPAHPDHDPKIAREWTYINIPAVVTEPRLAEALGLKLKTPTDPDVIEQFGDQPLAALWEDRKSAEFLATVKRVDPNAYAALYEGNPAPAEGVHFTQDMLIPYRLEELPRNLRKYGASDHALTTKQENDASVFGCVGIDEYGTIWVLPDVSMLRCETDTLVDEMVKQMKRHKPHFWWAEDEHIRKSIGPFLRKEMRKQKAYVTVVPMTPAKDLKLRSRSIHAMMRLGMVRFPTFAPWWLKAKNELLKFPRATHDDFVSWLAYIGLGLDMEQNAPSSKPKDSGNIIKVGSLAWVKQAAKREQRHERLHKSIGGF